MSSVLGRAVKCSLRHAAHVPHSALCWLRAELGVCMHWLVSGGASTADPGGTAVHISAAAGAVSRRTSWRA